MDVLWYCARLSVSKSSRDLVEWVFYVQCRGAGRLLFAEILYKYSETDFSPSGEIRKLSGNPYKRAKSPISTSPRTIDSKLRC